MKLDRNVNRGGRGKYALVQMRKLIPMIEKKESGEDMLVTECVLLNCFQELVDAGIITLGNESPGDQFFVMKYKDKFTHEALSAYAKAVCMEAAKDMNPDLFEYAEQMVHESFVAKNLGNRIPD